MLPRFNLAAKKCSLANSELCGWSTDPSDPRDPATYTIEGIMKLCEGIKGSAITSLECASSPPQWRSILGPFRLRSSQHAWLMLGQRFDWRAFICSPVLS